MDNVYVLCNCDGVSGVRSAHWLTTYSACCGLFCRLNSEEMLIRDLTEDDRRLLGSSTVLLPVSSSLLPLQLSVENRGAIGIFVGVA